MSALQKSSLDALARELLAAASASSSGRAARTVYGGHEHVLRQAVIALAAGQALAEHENPGEATVHVLHGRVRLGCGPGSWAGRKGDLLIVPLAPHSLEAAEDSAVLLTVAKTGRELRSQRQHPAAGRLAGHHAARTDQVGTMQTSVLDALARERSLRPRPRCLVLGMEVRPLAVRAWPGRR